MVKSDNQTRPGLLVAERQREITESLNEHKSVRVSDLARLYQVTEETIRRDLERLENLGKLVRSHGGAIAISQTASEKPFAERTVANQNEKVRIAREAVQWIKPGDSILFDASSTVWELAKILPDMQLTVLTNAINVAVELSDRPRIRVICTGGNLSSPSMSFAGPMAEHFLRDYHVDRAFISCSGIDVANGLSDVNESQAILKQTIINMADQIVLLADHTKFGVKSLRLFAPLESVTHLITGSELVSDTAESVRSTGVLLTIVGPMAVK